MTKSSNLVAKLNSAAWKAAAFILSRPAIAKLIVARAKRTPYYDIVGATGEVYMERYWLFNPYGKGDDGEVLPARWSWLPSIRIHIIRRPDDDRDLHDHPWDARTIILDGWYTELTPDESGDHTRPVMNLRRRGDTAPVLFEHYHRITDVSSQGVTTLFFTWKKRGEWGFYVDGKKILWREYLGVTK